MLKTERLYYTDCYLREFEARVVESRKDPKGCRVYLNRTAFYPESGGQPGDYGTLGGARVLSVIDESEAVAHLVEREPAAETVKGEIDWARRFDHMQQHTGQHILSAAFEKSGGYKTVSFHLGRETATVDLDSDRLGRRQIDEAEDLADRVVFEDREVRIALRAAADAAPMDLRKATERTGEVRLVEIADFDLSACGGTHVNRTGAVGLIAVRKFERMRGQTRVEFVCGGRALAAARRDFLTLGEAARLFSVSPGDLPALITKQVEELRAAARAREKLTEALAEYKARELWSTAPEKSGRKIVRHIFAAEEQSAAKRVAHVVAGLGSSVALIGVKGKPATILFSQSAGGSGDMGNLLKQVVAKFGGKGGGARDFAQGGGLDETRLVEALKEAEDLLFSGDSA